MTTKHVIKSRYLDNKYGIGECGLSTGRLTVPGGGCGAKQSSDCERTYVLYIPYSLCDEDDNEEEKQQSTSSLDGETRRQRRRQKGLEESSNHHNIQSIIPLVIAIHGFTGSNKAFLPWTDVAERYQFVLAIPDGLEKSWNAKFCCGYALEQNIDDVGFLQSLIATLSKKEYPSFQIRPDLVYGVGHSNGAFMVAYAASLFRAIAPISGYQYVNEVSELTSIVPSSSTSSIFMHHSKDDRVVKFMGCCTDPTMPECCCGISRFMDHCTPAYEAFHQWGSHVNGCRTGRTGSSSMDQYNNSNDNSTTSMGVVTNVSYSNDEVGVVCHTAVDCEANSTICIYEKSGHFPHFETNFPMKDEISEFFMKDACTVHGGVWNQKKGTCSISVGTKSKYANTESTDRVSEGRWIVSLIALTMIVLLGVFIWRRRRQGNKLHGWKQVPTSELELQ